jgi:hypothetical protein
VAHRTVRWCTGQCPVPRLVRRRTDHSREKKKVMRLKITGLSGEPTTLVANGRLHNQRATRGPRQRSVGTPDCPMCTGQCPVRQPDPRPNGRLRPIRKEIEHQTGTVHVRCTTRQKARFAFQVDLQRPLAALGL